MKNTDLTRTKYQHSTVVLMSDEDCGKCPERAVAGSPLCQRHLDIEATYAAKRNSR